MAVCGHPPLFCWLQLGFYASKQAVAATASSPGAKDDSFAFFGKGKATEVNQGGLAASRYYTAVIRFRFILIVALL